MTAGIEFDPAEREAIAASVNNAALRRADPLFKHVIRSASHVALYEFDNQSHVWKRCETEGSLFVVERDVQNKQSGRYRIVIINRKSLRNYSDDLVIGNRDIEAIDQMIMYCNSKGITVGIWFYENSEAADIYQVVSQIVSGQKVTPPPTKRILRRDNPSQIDSLNSDMPQNQSQSSKQENPLQRFFPDLKISDDVAGNAVPRNAKQSAELEDQSKNTVENQSESPTVFKPTAEIDEAIIHVSETAMPETTTCSNTTPRQLTSKTNNSFKSASSRSHQRSSKSTKRQPVKRAHGRKSSMKPDTNPNQNSSNRGQVPSDKDTRATPMSVSNNINSASPVKTESGTLSNLPYAIPVADIESGNNVNNNAMVPPSSSAPKESSDAIISTSHGHQEKNATTSASQASPMSTSSAQQVPAVHSQAQAIPISMSDMRYPTMPPFAQSCGMSHAIPSAMSSQMPMSASPQHATPFQSIHPQMAMMLHQQHQLYIQQQQQYMAHLRQHQMQMQSLSSANSSQGPLMSPVGQHKMTPPPESQLPMPTTSAKDDESKKVESANHLKRMLNVTHMNENEELKEEVSNEELAKQIGICISNTESKGELGNTNNTQANRASFRAVLRRLMTDKRLFECAFENYLANRQA